MGQEVHYPKDLRENMLFRANILRKAEKNVEFQAALWLMCQKDRLYFFNTFLWTYDPRTELKDLPFITYGYQDTFILWDAQCAEMQIDNFVEKSRDMGVTYMLCANDLYDWLFAEEAISIKWGSRKEDSVDCKGDPSTIFGKFRYMMRRLPKWLKPPKWDATKCDNHMKLINPKTGSLISGEATNVAFSRGDRHYRIRYDEFAFWDCDSEAWTCGADTTRCRTALSTPNGSANKFAELAKGGEDGQRAIEKMTIHWTLHPNKARDAYYEQSGEKLPIATPAAAYKVWKSGKPVRSPWYDMECHRRNEAEISQELDIDYLQSGRPFFYLPALRKQIVWKKLEREEKGAPLPPGYYITGRLVEVSNKVKFIESDSDWWLKIFQFPLKHMQFVISADVAEGLPKGDRSIGLVRDSYIGNLWADIMGQFPPDDFAVKLWLLGKYYNDGIVAPENNGMGYTVCKDLSEMGTNLYYAKKDETAKGEITTRKRGFTTVGMGENRRYEMLKRCLASVRKGLYEIRDTQIIQEMETFVHNAKKGGRPEAAGQFKDDCVMAWAIGDQIITEYPYRPKADQDTREHAYIEEIRVRTANGGFRF